MIEMTVHSLLDSGKYAVVVLKEVGGKRELQIIVGQYEAVAILRHLSGIREQRPLTHDLLKNLIEDIGGQVKRVTVNDLRGNIYYAMISLDVNGHEFDVDARPSDAIALAVRFSSPIFVEERVVEEAKSKATDLMEEGEAADEEEVDKKFREIVEGLEMEDLG